jgi:hypothetical protein
VEAAAFPRFAPGDLGPLAETPNVPVRGSGVRPGRGGRSLFLDDRGLGFALGGGLLAVTCAMTHPRPVTFSPGSWGVLCRHGTTRRSSAHRGGGRSVCRSHTVAPPRAHREHRWRLHRLLPLLHDGSPSRHDSVPRRGRQLRACDRSLASRFSTGCVRVELTHYRQT